MRRGGTLAFRERYGASPLHLAAHLVALALAAFALYRVFSDGAVPELIVLYLGLVIAHDLFFVPLYTGLDRLMRRVIVPPSSTRHLGVPVINHLRAPLLISALLLLIYSPLILGLSDSNYYGLSGHHLEHYLRNWLLISVAMLLGSMLIYAARVIIQARRGD